MTARGNPAGSAVLSTNYPVANTTFTPLASGGYWTTGSLKGGMVFVPASSGSFTVPVAGLCAITGTAWWTQNTLAIYQASAVHNGAQVASSSGEIYINPATGGYGVTTSFLELVQCAAGDTLGVSQPLSLDWEKNGVEPGGNFYPGLAAFLSLDVPAFAELILLDRLERKATKLEEVEQAVEATRRESDRDPRARPHRPEAGRRKPAPPK